jgi:hypothetical protein
LKAASRPARARIISAPAFRFLKAPCRLGRRAALALRATQTRSLSTLAGPLKRTTLETVNCVWWVLHVMNCVLVPPAADDQRNRNA